MTHFTLALVQLTVVATLTITSMTSSALELDLSKRTKSDIQLDSSRKPIKTINFVDVKSGDKVLDLLGGGGYYSELLSQVVGKKGEVVLQVPQAYLSFVGKELAQRLKDNRLENVNYLLSEAADLKLQMNHFDSAFLVLGYHDMFFKDQDWNFPADVVMPQVLASLKIGGKLLVIDHSAANNRDIKDTKTLHRIEANFVINDLKKYGFSLVKQGNFLKNINDTRKTSVFSPELRRKTDRFVLLFERTQ